MMEDKYKGKYRIPSTRLIHWNYNRESAYFITICTRDRINFFGDIPSLSSTDAMHRFSTDNIEKNIPKRIHIDAMHRVSTEPILQLSPIGKIAYSEWMKTIDIRPDMNLKLGAFIVMPNHFHAIISIGENKYNIHQEKEFKNKFGAQKKNLASIVRGYKSAVTIQARKIDPDFGWQPLYHDHIIRNEKAFNNISAYIENNPKKWLKDKLHQ